MNWTRFFIVSMAALASTATLPALAVPPNDDFADALVLEGPSGITRGTNVGATREASEPLIDGYEGGRSVWWRWVAPTTEKVTVHTFGSDFDTILGVYTGTAVSSLQLVAENDDEGDEFQSLVAFGAIAGSVYHFVVDGVDGEFGAESGDISLAWLSAPAPENDSFANRIRLEGGEGQVLASNAGATREAGEPDHVESLGTQSIWWSWVAPGDGTAEINTSGSTFDTVLAVYNGASVNSLVLVVENDDDEVTDALTSAVRFQAVGGTEYQIAVDGYEGESGIVALGWLFIARGEARFIRGDCDDNGAVNISDAVFALDWLFQGGATPECAATANVDGIGAVDVTDPIYLLAYLFRGGPTPVAPFPECGRGTLEADLEIGCWQPPRNCR